MKRHECGATRNCLKCKMELPATSFPKVGNRCKDCGREYLNAWRKANVEKRQAQRVREYEKDGERIRAYTKSYAQANPEKAKSASAKWQSENREHLRNTRRERYQKDVEFRDNLKSRNSARHKRLRQSMPAWVTRASLRTIFEMAIRLTSETGVMHHVDHIIPLRGKLVSGLTVPANLRVITASENCKKNSATVEDIVWTWHERPRCTG